jgi:CubicO group peptidase (beta-lactamase class C family)
MLASHMVAAAPDEELLGKSKGYLVGIPTTWFYDEAVRVGSFSHLDEIFEHHVLAKSPSPLPLEAAPAPPFTYRFESQDHSIEDYLQRQRVTGLLIIKDGAIVFERYQYDRKPSDRLVSHSMVKSITGLGIGFALQEGKIKSLDDKVSSYVTELRGTLYGETSIRHLLRMSSGVRFNEAYDGKDDLARFGALRRNKGLMAAFSDFTERESPEGEKFHYVSAETELLGSVLRAATGDTLAAYIAPRLWQPMGAESDATWIVDAAGLESAAGSFNAVLRDYGRLGILLANDGAVGGKQILPKDYLLEATDWHRQPANFAPGLATPYFGYGYQFWLFPGAKRRFALIGVYGQAIFVDPELKLVMVHTAVAKNAGVTKESLGAERVALWRGLVKHYGTWE